MSARDPSTGQFVSSDNLASYDDYEIANFSIGVGVEASNLSGGTGFGGGDNTEFEGLLVLDYDEYVDRGDMLRLIAGWHRMSVYANSTSTADGTVQASAEISSSPAISDPALSIQSTQSIDSSPQQAVGLSVDDDTIDTIGRVLSAVGTTPFSDGATGVGGGGSAGEDQVMLDASVYPAEVARFDARDELFLNGELTSWNVDDTGIHIQIHGQHVYGVDER